MTNDNIIVISSDGHATALMRDYEPYLDAEFREEFRAFVPEFEAKGHYSSEPETLLGRLDPEVVQRWKENIVDAGRLEGRYNSEARIRHQDRDGVSAEILIPDFGTPFILYSPFLSTHLGVPWPDRAHLDAGNRAFNRWLVDFMSIAPKRFAGMLAFECCYADAVPDTVKEIEWGAERGFKGLMVPFFDEDLPLYDPVFDPIWSALEDHDMVLNSHTAISGTSRRLAASIKSAPHPACTTGIMMPQTEFLTHNVLEHLVWGGVLERHPKLKVVLTEQASSWVPSKLIQMDYSWKGSWRRQDIRDVVRLAPSEYFQRQVYLGSSLFSREEVSHRHEIGIDKMMMGMDYPHHEGTWEFGTPQYLRATFGAVRVPEAECRQMLAGNHAAVYGFDLDYLQVIANKVGPSYDDIMTPLEEDLYPRGDVNKPMAGMTA